MVPVVANRNSVSTDGGRPAAPRQPYERHRSDDHQQRPNVAHVTPARGGNPRAAVQHRPCHGSVALRNSANRRGLQMGKRAQRTSPMGIGFPTRSPLYQPAEPIGDRRHCYLQQPIGSPSGMTGRRCARHQSRQRAVQPSCAGLPTDRVMDREKAAQCRAASIRRGRRSAIGVCFRLPTAPYSNTVRIAIKESRPSMRG